MAHGDSREGKWRWNWRMECVASTLHTTSEHDVSNITTADAHTSADSSRLNWRPRRFKWTLSFRRKTKSGFCACAIIFQTQSTHNPPPVPAPREIKFPQSLTCKVSEWDEDPNLQNTADMVMCCLVRTNHTWDGGGSMIGEGGIMIGDYGAMVEWSLVGGNRINRERILLGLSFVQHIIRLWGESSSLC